MNTLNTLLLGTSFLAGALTILAPCVLPLLPVIIGSTAGSKNPWKPLIVTVSLALSIVLFTLLLKASSILIDIPQSFWTTISGGIVLIFGIFLLVPEWWEFIAIKLNFSQSAQTSLQKATEGESLASSILIGAALGPVFSSCSPTYFVILATVLPVNFFAGLIYLFTYAFGLILTLGTIGFFGQRIISKLKWAANPKGLFKRAMGLLLILVGLAVITGIEKKIEIAILDAGYGVTSIEEKLLDDMKPMLDEMGGKIIEPPITPEKISSLPFLYKAPELIGVTNWINSEPILSMNDLKGKVVLIDFWTYSCINCIRTLPYLQSWHEKYADKGLTIIGVHAPEFQFEQKLENVQKAVKDFGLTYAVVQDNDFQLWRAYNNRYWPAKYLIDPNGIVRYTNFGEGKYEETEMYIAELLKTQMSDLQTPKKLESARAVGTPETYIGLSRRANFVNPNSINPTDPLKLNEWTLIGEWREDAEKATNQTANASIKMRFKASQANLVIGGTGEATILIDGQIANETNSGKDVTDGKLIINGERLYELTNFGDAYSEHEIEIIFLEPEISIFAWTFG